MNNSLYQNYWNTRYQQHQIGWDLSTISSPLKAYFERLEDKSLKILILGGYLIEQGFTDVTVVDVSQEVIANLQKRFSDYLNQGLTLLHQDFFAHRGQYDLIVKQTFFVHLTLRSAWTTCAKWIPF